MKTILITGDSWGVVRSENLHTDCFLRNAGYDVHNISSKGSSNLDSIWRIKKYLELQPLYINGIKYHLKNSIQPDWIVFFHTEILRDYFKPPIYFRNSINTAIEKISHITYKSIFELKNNLDCKLAIIGGQGPIEKNIYKYGEPDFIIEDWRSEIIGEQLPKNHTWGCLKVIKESPDDLEFKNRELDNIEYIKKVLKDSYDFPDDAHPGHRPHLDLGHRLKNIIN